MSMSVSDTLIGRMFARSEMASMYARQKNADQSRDETVDGTAQGDRVELSANAPRPLDARMIDEAVQVAQRMASGQTLSPSQTQRLREDRVFASLTALFAVGANKGRIGDAWFEGNAEAPSGMELESTFRRLSQRVAELDQSMDPRKVEESRLAALEAFRGIDFQELARVLSASIAGVSAAPQD